MIPPLSNGTRYGADKDGQRICLGALMGRPNQIGVRGSEPCPKLHLYRLRFVDGCYDEGGAYWGAPATVYRAVSADGSVELFVRGFCTIGGRPTGLASRKVAKEEVLANLPHAKFYRA